MTGELISAFDNGSIIYLILGATLAGLVRGFSGFGTAMVFIPIAGQVLSPIATLTVLFVMDLIGPIPNIPRALRDGQLVDVSRLFVGSLIGAPIGVYLLTLMSEDVFRLSGASFSLLLLVLLIFGVRYRGTLSKGLIYLTGSIGGLFGGAVGIPGPPVIMLYMASTLPPAVIRANNTLFLLVVDVLFFSLFWLKGLLLTHYILIGIIIAVPYLTFCILGAFLFNPRREKIYRIMAYIIIFISAFSALPIWG
ncbi:MAG: sulfite exporter TauE/SafE family protein [Paracoccaceae bacterium]